MIQRSNLEGKSLTSETRSTQEVISTTNTFKGIPSNKQLSLSISYRPKNVLKTDITKILVSSKSKEENKPQNQIAPSRHERAIEGSEFQSPLKPEALRYFNIFDEVPNEKQPKQLNLIQGFQMGNIRLLNSNKKTCSTFKNTTDPSSLFTNKKQELMLREEFNCNGTPNHYYNKALVKNSIPSSKSGEVPNKNLPSQMTYVPLYNQVKSKTPVSIEQGIIKNSQMTFQNLELKLRHRKTSIPNSKEHPEARFDKMQNALFQMKSKLYEIKIYSCSCDLFRFDIQSKIISVLDNTKYSKRSSISGQKISFGYVQ